MYLDTAFPLELAAVDSQDTWDDVVVGLGGGAEQRAILWSDSKRMYNANTADNITIPNLNSIRQHFNAVRARGYAFKLRDRSFCQASTEGLGIGGGIGSTNQLSINDGNASNAYNREIYLPENGTIVIRANTTIKTEGTDYTLAYTGATGGLITWLTSVSGLSLTWTGSFYIPVRYDVKSFPSAKLFIWNSDNTGLVKGPNLPMIEVRYQAEFA